MATKENPLLLKSQKDEVYRDIGACGFNPADFEWQYVRQNSDGYGIERLVHVPTGFYWEPGIVKTGPYPSSPEACRIVEYSPGGSTGVETVNLLDAQETGAAHAPAPRKASPPH